MHSAGIWKRKKIDENAFKLWKKLSCVRENSLFPRAGQYSSWEHCQHTNTVGQLHTAVKARSSKLVASSQGQLELCWCNFLSFKTFWKTDLQEFLKQLLVLKSFIHFLLSVAAKECINSKYKCHTTSFSIKSPIY